VASAMQVSRQGCQDIGKPPGLGERGAFGRDEQNA